MSRLERTAISALVGGVWLVYCLVENPAPPLPVWPVLSGVEGARWAVALLISAWWAFALWRWTANRAK